MLKHVILVASLGTLLSGVDLGSVDVNATAETEAVEQNSFEGVFEDVEYYEESNYVSSMPSQKRITKDEAMFIPGIQGDPIKAVQSLSGVTSVGDASGELFIYGSKPEETITTINHLPLGYLFHLGGLHSVIAPDAIEQIDAYMAGFDTSYGNAMGGVLNVTPAYPTDTFSGYGHVGLYDASAGINVAVNDEVSFYLGVRRSYFDLLLSAIGKATGTLDEDSNTTYTEFPNYHDITFIGKYSLDSSNLFSLELVSAMDALEIASYDNAIKDPEAVGNIKAKYGFTTLGARHQGFYNDYESNTLAYYKYEHQRVALFDGYYVNSNSSNLGLFHQSTFDLGSHRLIAGVEVDSYRSPIDLNASEPPRDDNPDYDFTDSDKYVVNETIQSTMSTLFVQDIYSYSDSLVLKYGARYNYTNYNSMGGYLDPRASVLYKIDDTNNISFATGIYTQMPTGYKTIDELGNTDLSFEKAEHYVLHYDTSMFENITFNIDGFYKRYYDLVIDDEIDNYLNKGEGYAYGLDTNFKMKQNNYYLFAAYTYMQAKRDLSTSNDSMHRFYGEVPHTLQLIAGKKFWKTWALSTRINYHSGKPYTKVTGTYTDDDGRVRPIYEDPFSSRLPSYFMLNIKIAQEIKFAKNESLEWSFEIMNVTNHENISEINYDDNYEVTGYAKQLPILPWFDVTYRF